MRDTDGTSCGGLGLGNRQVLEQRIPRVLHAGVVREPAVHARSGPRPTPSAHCVANATNGSMHGQVRQGTNHTWVVAIVRGPRVKGRRLSWRRCDNARTAFRRCQMMAMLGVTGLGHQGCWLFASGPGYIFSSDRF